MPPYCINRRRRQCGGGSLMVHGCLMPNGLIFIKKIVGNQKAMDYTRLLKQFVVPCMNLNCETGFNFVQDNAPIHTAKETKVFLQQQHFKTLCWPANSPDLNPIENVWKMISDLVYKEQQPHNSKELEEKIDDAVNRINQYKRNVLKNLYVTFRTRLVDVLKLRGNLINH